MYYLALATLGVVNLLIASSRLSADSARYRLPLLEEAFVTGPINDPATHWAEIFLEDSSHLGFTIQCYFADKRDRGKLYHGKENREVSLQKVARGKYGLASNHPTEFSAVVQGQQLRHCTLVLHHLAGYALFKGKSLPFTDRYVYIADSRSTISWLPDETSEDISNKVTELLSRYKLVGSVYYKDHVYLTMEDRTL